MQPKQKREKAVRDSKTSIILDAARDVFVRCGYHATRLEDIAEAAGFTKTALYYYFEDKEEIFLSLCFRELDQFTVKILEIRKLPLDFATMFSEMARVTFTIFGKHFSFLLMIFNFKMPEINPGGFLKYKREINQFKDKQLFFERHISDLIAELKTRGEIKCDIETDFIANYLGSLIRGILFKWFCDGKLGNPELEIQNLLKFVTPALGLKNPDPKNQ
jgi:AcrR family transcriptional regulator